MTNDLPVLQRERTEALKHMRRTLTLLLPDDAYDAFVGKTTPTAVRYEFTFGDKTAGAITVDPGAPDALVRATIGDTTLVWQPPAPLIFNPRPVGNAYVSYALEVTRLHAIKPYIKRRLAVTLAGALGALVLATIVADIALPDLSLAELAFTAPPAVVSACTTQVDKAFGHKAPRVVTFDEITPAGKLSGRYD